jgi:23S rRNA pseudouridine1911/1915/1917 synthase
MAGEPRAVTLAATDADRGLRLDQFLARHLAGVSRAQVQQLIRAGHVRLSRGRPKPSLAVEPGVEVAVEIPPARPAVPGPEALPLAILHDDRDVVVVDKPAGMVVHPGAGHATGTLVNALLHHVRGLSGIGGRERPGIIHRLDRGTSGVMVVAKHDRAHRALSRQFQERRVEKEYVALVWGTVPAGLTIDRPVGRHPAHRTKMSGRARRGKPALTEVIRARALGGVTLVTVRIATGRTHQIRVHLSEAGHPVVGDRLYGGERRTLPPRLRVLARLDRPFLHAARLAFTHPSTGEPVAFDAPLPDDLAGVLRALETSAGDS